MKKIIIAFILIVFIPVSYVVAEDKQTVEPAKNKTVILSKEYIPLPAGNTYYIFKERMTKETEKEDFLDCIEGQRQIISSGMISTGNEEIKPHQGYHSTVWVTIQCMKNRGYVETKHKIYEYPYPDYH